MSPRPGSHRPPFGRYRLLSLLGVGGYARVYRAEELDRASRVVAVQLPPAGDEGPRLTATRTLPH